MSECFVCFEELEEPYVGACGHSICLACLNKLGQEEKKTCPKCRRDVTWTINYQLRELLERGDNNDNGDNNEEPTRFHFIVDEPTLVRIQPRVIVEDRVEDRTEASSSFDHAQSKRDDINCFCWIFVVLLFALACTNLAELVPEHKDNVKRLEKMNLVEGICSWEVHSNLIECDEEPILFYMAINTSVTLSSDSASKTQVEGVFLFPSKPTLDKQFTVECESNETIMEWFMDHDSAPCWTHDVDAEDAIFLSESFSQDRKDLEQKQQWIMLGIILASMYFPCCCVCCCVYGIYGIDKKQS